MQILCQKKTSLNLFCYETFCVTHPRKIFPWIWLFVRSSTRLSVCKLKSRKWLTSFFWFFFCMRFDSLEIKWRSAIFEKSLDRSGEIRGPQLPKGYIGNEWVKRYEENIGDKSLSVEHTQFICIICFAWIWKYYRYFNFYKRVI